MKPKDVDEYIASCPSDVQSSLKKIRSVIKKAAPKAEEKISYGMPYYGYKGRLAYFRLAKKHIGLYIPPPVIEEHKDELKGYVTAKSTVQFPLSQKLPIKLIEKLVKARVKINESRGKE
ncbi:MAG TPA: DUF1801 domain-containing protein [Patescibacteria group bacterium]